MCKSPKPAAILLLIIGFICLYPASSISAAQYWVTVDGGDRALPGTPGACNYNATGGIREALNRPDMSYSRDGDDRISYSVGLPFTDYDLLGGRSYFIRVSSVSTGNIE